MGGLFGTPNAEALCGLEGRIDCRQTLSTSLVSVMTSAARSAVISMRVPSATKANLAALAARHQLSEAGLLSKLIDEVLKSNVSADRRIDEPVVERKSALSTSADDRITLRLRQGDRTLAAERAGSRGMKTGSYLALLIHNHVRETAVLPPHELDAIKAVAAQLAALGRQLRMFGMPNILAEPAASELFDLVAQARHEVELARATTAEVVRRNLISWEVANG